MENPNEFEWGHEYFAYSGSQGKSTFQMHLMLLELADGGVVHTNLPVDPDAMREYLARHYANLPPSVLFRHPSSS